MERIALKRKEYSAKDRESGQVVEFGENVPIGESGKEYGKSYVSIPKEGGWKLKDKETGEIVSKNVVIGYSDYEGMDDAARLGAVINISVCQACGSVFQNPHFLELHASKVHGKTAEQVLENKRNEEEDLVQAQLASSAKLAEVASTSTLPSPEEAVRMKRKYTKKIKA